MEWLKRMMDAVDHVEKHLEEPLDVAEVAGKAYSSTFHFQRMFHMLTGNTLAEYVRRRRLTLAAQEMAVSRARIIDIAFKYGYETPESFTKAFKRLHGISPSAAREPGVSLKAHPRISFHLSLKGDKEMDYKMVEKGSFKVVGKSIRVSTRDGENLKKIPEFWHESYINGFTGKLEKVAGSMGGLGICWNDYNNEQFTYIIGIEKPQVPISIEVEEFEVPSATWAVFESVGPMPHAIQKVWERIYSEWFPATNFECADAPQLEVYPAGDADDENYRCEVWVPVVIKK